jgi:methyl-accepting chemotaxis protein
MSSPIRYLRRRPLARKLALSSLAFSLPLAVLLYFLADDTVRQVRFARTEQTASAVLRPLVTVLDLLPNHARLSLAARGEHARARRERAETVARLDAAFTEAMALLARHEVELRLDDHTLGDRGLLELSRTELTARWQELRVEGATAAPADVVVRHRRLEQAVFALVRRIGDTGNIILDQELDSFYLGQALVDSLPHTLDELGRLQTTIELGLATGQAPVATDVGVAVTLAETFALQEAAAGLRHAVRQDYRFHGESPSLQQNMPAAVSRFEGMVRPVRDRTWAAATKGDRRELAAVLELVVESQAEAHRLWQLTSTEFDTLLGYRLRDLYLKAGLTAGVSLLALVLAVVLVVALARDIVRPLNDVVEIAGHVAAGDLDRAGADIAAMEGRHGFRYGPEGEGSKSEVERLARAIRSMAESLRGLIAQMHRSGQQVAEDAATVASSTRQLEATVVENGAATHEAGATARAIAAAAQALLATVQAISQFATVAGETAADGRASLGGMEAEMQRLTAATAALAQRLSAIHEGAENIGGIVGTIGRVADRSNLLSTNAGIEAEKAGAAGRGFGVVAREMRRLADQTATATVEISQLVDEMRAVVAAGAREMDGLVRQVRNSSADVRGVGERLGHLITHVEHLGPQLHDLASTMQTQAGGATQIAEALGQIETAAQQTRQALEQLGRVALRLDGATHDLTREVSQFRLE